MPRGMLVRFGDGLLVIKADDADIVSEPILANISLVNHQQYVNFKDCEVYKEQETVGNVINGTFYGLLVQMPDQDNWLTVDCIEEAFDKSLGLSLIL